MTVGSLTAARAGMGNVVLCAGRERWRDNLMLNLCVLIFFEYDYISVHFISPFKHLCSCVMIN